MPEIEVCSHFCVVWLPGLGVCVQTCAVVLVLCWEGWHPPVTWLLRGSAQWLNKVVLVLPLALAWLVTHGDTGWLPVAPTLAVVLGVAVSRCPFGGKVIGL